MLPKNLFLPLFVFMCLGQWFIPFQTVRNQNDILKTGTVFKFKTIPVDPIDALRGHYIQLNFENTNFPYDSSLYITYGQTIFALLSTDESGFAKITKIQIEKPETDTDFFKATVAYTYKDSVDMAALQLPFDKFFMEESKAPEVEKKLNQLFQENKTSVYAKVRIKNGQSSLEDVIVDTVSVKNWFIN